MPVRVCEATFPVLAVRKADVVPTGSFPALFTKRSTSIVASNEDVYSHSRFTDSLDYEGEVAVIIGKPGFGISQEDAMDHVWGYTILNGKIFLYTASTSSRPHRFLIDNGFSNGNLSIQISQRETNSVTMANS